MIVSVGDVAAKCPGCGGADFTPGKPGELRLASVLVCSGCGAASTYQELLDRIGEEAIRRANESLESLKKKGSPRRKPGK